MPQNDLFDQYLDLRGIPCPTNFVRCCLVLETLSNHEHLKVSIDKGEPKVTVIQGLIDNGYLVESIIEESNCITFIVSCEIN